MRRRSSVSSIPGDRSLVAALQNPVGWPDRAALWEMRGIARGGRCSRATAAGGPPTNSSPAGTARHHGQPGSFGDVEVLVGPIPGSDHAVRRRARLGWCSGPSLLGEGLGYQAAAGRERQPVGAGLPRSSSMLVRNQHPPHPKRPLTSHDAGPGPILFCPAVHGHSRSCASGIGG